MLIPTEIEFKDNFMIIQYKGDSIVQTINTFQKNTGVTIANPQFDIPAYVLQLKLFGTNLICGNVIENLIGYLKNVDVKNATYLNKDDIYKFEKIVYREIVLIIDFDEVIDVSTNFLEEYTKFLLSTKSKVLSINQNTNIINAFSDYVISIIDIQDVAE